MYPHLLASPTLEGTSFGECLSCFNFEYRGDVPDDCVVVSDECCVLLVSQERGRDWALRCALSSLSHRRCVAAVSVGRRVSLWPHATCIEASSHQQAVDMCERMRRAKGGKKKQKKRAESAVEEEDFDLLHDGGDVDDVGDNGSSRVAKKKRRRVEALCQVPQVSKKKAIALLRTFGSVQNVAHLTQQQMQIQKIGKETAQSLEKFFQLK